MFEKDKLQQVLELWNSELRHVITDEATFHLEFAYIFFKVLSTETRDQFIVLDFLRRCRETKRFDANIYLMLEKIACVDPTITKAYAESASEKIASSYASSIKPSDLLPPFTKE